MFQPLHRAIFRSQDIQGAAREMTCFDMDCTRPVGEVEGWGWWAWALYKMSFSCRHAFLVA